MTPANWNCFFRQSAVRTHRENSSVTPSCPLCDSHPKTEQDVKLIVNRNALMEKINGVLLCNIIILFTFRFTVAAAF